MPGKDKQRERREPSPPGSSSRHTSQSRKRSHLGPVPSSHYSTGHSGFSMGQISSENQPQETFDYPDYSIDDAWASASNKYRMDHGRTFTQDSMSNIIEEYVKSSRMSQAERDEMQAEDLKLLNSLAYKEESRVRRRARLLRPEWCFPKIDSKRSSTPLHPCVASDGSIGTSGKPHRRLSGRSNSPSRHPHFIKYTNTRDRSHLIARFTKDPFGNHVLAIISVYDARSLPCTAANKVFGLKNYPHLTFASPSTEKKTHRTVTDEIKATVIKDSTSNEKFETDTKDEFPFAATTVFDENGQPLEDKARKAQSSVVPVPYREQAPEGSLRRGTHDFATHAANYMTELGYRQRPWLGAAVMDAEKLVYNHGKGRYGTYDRPWRDSSIPPSYRNMIKKPTTLVIREQSPVRKAVHGSSQRTSHSSLRTARQVSSTSGEPAESKNLQYHSYANKIPISGTQANGGRTRSSRRFGEDAIRENRSIDGPSTAGRAIHPLVQPGRRRSNHSDSRDPVSESESADEDSLRRRARSSGPANPRALHRHKDSSSEPSDRGFSRGTAARLSSSQHYENKSGKGEKGSSRQQQTRGRAQHGSTRPETYQRDGLSRDRVLRSVVYDTRDISWRGRSRSEARLGDFFQMDEPRRSSHSVFEKVQAPRHHQPYSERSHRERAVPSHPRHRATTKNQVEEPSISL